MRRCRRTPRRPTRCSWRSSSRCVPRCPSSSSRSTTPRVCSPPPPLSVCDPSDGLRRAPAAPDAPPEQPARGGGARRHRPCRRRTARVRWRRWQRAGRLREVDSKPSRGGRPIGSAASGGLFAAPRFASRVWQVHYLSGTGGERHADEQPVAAGGGGGGGGLVASADARPTAAPRLCAERRAAAACGRRQRGAGPRMRRQRALGPRAPRRPSSTRYVASHGSNSGHGTRALRPRG